MSLPAPVLYLKGVLHQKRQLLSLIRSIDAAASVDRCNQILTTSCKVSGATIGQHLRHSLDHIRKVTSSSGSAISAKISYDVRDRGTTIETCIESAEMEVISLQRIIEPIGHGDLNQPVVVKFMLGGENSYFENNSTLGRELAFVAHHGIHHHATISSIILNNPESFPRELCSGLTSRIPGFGIAPSTQYSRDAGY